MPETISGVAELMDLDKIIAYLESTTDDQWLTEICRSEDGSKNCVMGHIFNYGGGDAPVTDSGVKERTAGSLAWDWFENIYATTYMIYDVNDGRNPRYQQPTPKARCIAYLTAMRDGREKTTPQLQDDDWRNWAKDQIDGQAAELGLSLDDSTKAQAF